MIDAKNCIVYHTDDLLMQDVKIPIYIQRANALKHEFSKFWIGKGFNQGADFNGFTIKHVEFLTDHASDSHNDCGVYVMHQMLRFRGEVYKDYTLTTPNRRMRFRATVLATLIHCDYNIRRDAVIAAATDLYENRDERVETMKKRLQEKNNIEEQEKKKKKKEEKNKKKIEVEFWQSHQETLDSMDQQAKKVAGLVAELAEEKWRKEEEEEEKKKKKEEEEKSKGGLKIRLRSSTRLGDSDVTIEKQKLFKNMAKDVEKEQAENEKNYQAEMDRLREAKQTKKKDDATPSVVASSATAPAVGGAAPSDVTYKRRVATKPPLAPKK